MNQFTEESCWADAQDQMRHDDEKEAAWAYADDYLRRVCSEPVRAWFFSGAVEDLANHLVAKGRGEWFWDDDASAWEQAIIAEMEDVA